MKIPTIEVTYKPTVNEDNYYVYLNGRVVTYFKSKKKAMRYARKLERIIVWHDTIRTAEYGSHIEFVWTVK
jgi:hypothetical protein